MTSPCKEKASFRTFVSPAAFTNSILLTGRCHNHDFHFRKITDFICATWDFESLSGSHPWRRIFLAYSLTGFVTGGRNFLPQNGLQRSLELWHSWLVYFSSSVWGWSGKSGTLNPLPVVLEFLLWWGMEALMFKAGVMFVSGWVANWLSSERASGIRWFFPNRKLARIRPASEMSFDSNSTPPLEVKARRIGKRNRQ